MRILMKNMGVLQGYEIVAGLLKYAKTQKCDYNVSKYTILGIGRL